VRQGQPGGPRMKGVVMMKGVALAAGIVAVLAAYPSAAPARPKPAGSLCRAPGRSCPPAT